MKATERSLRPVVEHYLQMFQNKPFEKVGITITPWKLMLTFPTRGGEVFEQNFYENLINDISIHKDKLYFHRKIDDHNINYGKGTVEHRELTSQKNAIKALSDFGYGKFQEENRLNKKLVQIYQNICAVIDAKQTVDEKEINFSYFRFRMTEYRLEYAIEFWRSTKDVRYLRIQNDCIDYKYSEEAKQFLTGLVQNTEIIK